MYIIMNNIYFSFSNIRGMEGYLNCNAPHCNNFIHRKCLFLDISKSCIKTSVVNIPLARLVIHRLSGWSHHVKE